MATEVPRPVAHLDLEMTRRVPCPDCEEGLVEYEDRNPWHYQGDEIEPRWYTQTCKTCGGEGTVEIDDDEELGGEA